MYTIKTLNNIAPAGLAKLGPAQFKVDNEADAPQGILVRSAKMHEMELPESLLAIGRAGAGVNNIPVEKCSEAGVVVFNTPGANAGGVAELTIGGLVLASRNLLPAMEWAQGLAGEGDAVPALVEKGKSQFVGPELAGKKLDLLVIPQEFLSGNVPHRTHAAEALLLLLKPCYLRLESLTHIRGLLLVLYGTLLQHLTGQQDGVFLIAPDSPEHAECHQVNVPKRDTFCVADIGTVQPVSI